MMSLTAPRFRNDPVLEACLAGTHRMLNGEPSAGSVVLVQQALIDSGYKLPKFGPDGNYGGETAAAVSKFKADRGVQPSDGVVGPKTMGHLMTSSKMSRGLYRPRPSVWERSKSRIICWPSKTPGLAIHPTVPSNC
jgi:peptidoglycan hydrolase-like protein with peptidoglycan-binding domain